MRVLLLKDVRGLGHAGDVKEVAGGYATNYLFPNKLARQVTEGAVKQVEEAKEAVQKKQERKASETKTLANRLNGQTVVFKVRSGEGERLYGSITAGDIADALAKSTGLAVDRRLIQLEHPLKTLGHHQVILKMGGGQTATITAVVERAAEVA